MTPKMADQRQQVLNAIKRTVEDNCGDTLGQTRFYTETGLTLTDLHNAGFLNYGAALEAAGFQRNTLKQALPDEQIFPPLVEFVRLNKRLPTHAERITAHKQDSTIPSDDVYRRRARQEPLELALISWCRGKPELADVAAILEALRNSKLAKRAPRKKRKKVIKGYVYLKRYRKNGKHFKLGKSERPGRRHAQIESMTPEELIPIYEIPTEYPDGIERYWKDRFKDRRVKGEIYRLTPEDIAAFKSGDYR